jgi:hypothetical protein
MSPRDIPGKCAVRICEEAHTCPGILPMSGADIAVVM